jgi:hypothetical protein
MTAIPRVSPAAVLLLAAVACRVERQRSPVCGMALLVGPSLIQQQMADARALLTDAPRGLPSTLPARVAGSADTGRVLVGNDTERLELELQGIPLPVISVDSTRRDSTVFALLLVDDSTSVVQGVLLYERDRPPAEYPRLGVVASGSRNVPLYGLRLNWSSVSNPQCPLLGGPATP